MDFLWQSKDKLYRVKLNDINKIFIMQTIRYYIRNYKQLAFSDSHHTPTTSQKSRIHSNILQTNKKEY